ncbi:uncharacterized protein METZ01_LOCUS391359, partial [marine metagenome]
AWTVFSMNCEPKLRCAAKTPKI